MPAARRAAASVTCLECQCGLAGSEQRQNEQSQLSHSAVCSVLDKIHLCSRHFLNEVYDSNESLAVTNGGCLRCQMLFRMLLLLLLLLLRQSISKDEKILPSGIYILCI